MGHLLSMSSCPWCGRFRGCGYESGATDSDWRRAAFCDFDCQRARSSRLGLESRAWEARAALAAARVGSWGVYRAGHRWLRDAVDCGAEGIGVGVNSGSWSVPVYRDVLGSTAARAVLCFRCQTVFEKYTALAGISR